MFAAHYSFENFCHLRVIWMFLPSLFVLFPCRFNLHRCRGKRAPSCHLRTCIKVRASSLCVWRFLSTLAFSAIRAVPRELGSGSDHRFVAVDRRLRRVPLSSTWIRGHGPGFCSSSRWLNGAFVLKPPHFERIDLYSRLTFSSLCQCHWLQVTTFHRRHPVGGTFRDWLAEMGNMEP